MSVSPEALTQLGLHEDEFKRLFEDLNIFQDVRISLNLTVKPEKEIYFQDLTPSNLGFSLEVTDERENTWDGYQTPRIPTVDELYLFMIVAKEKAPEHPLVRQLIEVGKARLQIDKDIHETKAEWIGKMLQNFEK